MPYHILMPFPRGRFARLSLAQKVPLVAGGLILTVAAAVSVASYLEVRHTARRGAYQHIADVTQMVQASTQGMGAQLARIAHPIASNPAIAAYLRSPDLAHQPGALVAMLARNASANRVLASELHDDSGRLVLSTNPTIADAPSDFPPVVPPTDSVAVGKLRLLDDGIVYPVSARIPGFPHAYLVQWRHATGSGQAAVQMRQLIGAGATLLLGNADGSFWTDLAKHVPGPTSDVRTWQGPVEYTRSSAEGAVLAGGVPIAETPLAFAVEFPLREVMAPADTFLRDIVFIALALAAIGALAAWWFARRLTLPLQQLTVAADAIAAGEHAAVVPLARTDELGRLAASFEVMALQVRDSRQRLEESVTERTKELHDALHRLEDAQEALIRREKLAMLGQLAGGVGHELRNPLGVMSNAIYYLEMVLQSSPENVRDYLRLLREQVALSSKIVGDLLDFARIPPAQRRPVHLRGILDAQLARLSGHERVNISVDVPHSLPPADVDSVHIGQIVFNLLTNAVQAMNGDEGALRIAARRQGDDSLELRISDSGPGVPPDLADRIFEPLFTTKARGIGLGLAVSRALAQANNSRIAVANDTTRGATFVITMPMATEQRA
jgi:signal transduction histidine kinase